MRRTTRRTASAFTALAVAASLALTGCGRDSGSEAGPGASKAISDAKASGTINVWAMGTEGEKLQDFVKDFESANPDATVKVTAVPWEAAHDKISAAIASGKTPDVSLIGTTWMGEFAKAGGLDPTPDGLVKDSDFYDGAWGSTVVGNTSYGVPWYVETRVLYYRTDLAKKAGWDKAPTTWDEFSKFAADLKKSGVKYPVSLQPGQTGSWQTVLPFAWSNGAKVTNGSGTEYSIDSPQMSEALNYYKSFFDKGYSQTRMLDPGELENGFAKGTYGSFISGPWHIGLVEDAGLTKDKYAVAPLPGKDSGPGTSFTGGGDLAVFKDAKNRDGAWKLVRWLSDAQTQSKWYDTVKDLPAVKSAWQSGDLAGDQQLQVFGRQLDSAEAPPAVPSWEQVASVIDGDVEKAVKGSVPTSDAVADMQKQAKSIGTGL
ncbi:MAG TPA: sugar ABC transporter substrate-binding protein [Nocardioidaceae bacterium]|jgi:multiple sugar transport system substrate-binding protein|nr:sugar ABC transporter substrate-binding protein [Nocardioidaceae bacterium]